MDEPKREGSLRGEGRERASLRQLPPPGNWRLLVPAGAAWVFAAAAIGVPGSARWVCLAVLGIGVAALIGACVRRSRDTRLRVLSSRFLGAVLLGVALLAVIGLRIDAAERVRADPLLHDAAIASQEIALPGVLRSFPETLQSPFGERAWVRADVRAPSGAVPVLLWLDDAGEERWGPGTPVRLTGVPEKLEAASVAAYAISVREITPDERSQTAVGEPGRWDPRAILAQHTGELAAALRSQLRAAAAEVPGAELVPGFAVGDTSLVSSDLDAAMQASSLTHLTAVSGANCALVIAAVVAVASRCGVGRRARMVLAGGALAGFVVVVGPDASVQRAAVMATVVLISQFGGKGRAALPALGLAVLVLLAADPWQARQPGFTLSVAATAGILLMSTPTQQFLQRRLRLPKWIALPVAVAVSAQFACGPLLLFLAPGIPAVGILANVLAAPAAPMGTGFGLLALVLLPLAPTIGTIVVWVSTVPTRWVAATAEVTATLPGARWHWPEGWTGALLLAGCETALVVAWLIRDAQRHASRAAVASWLPPRPASRGARVAVTLLLSFSLATVVSVTVLAPAVVRIGTPHDWAVVACDVGQGDALLLRDPTAPAEVMLVDTGADTEALRSCLDRFRVERVALLVLSHDDLDHVGALSEVVGEVDAAIIAPATQEFAGADAPQREVERELRAAEVPTTVGVAGDRGALMQLAGERGGPHARASRVSWEVFAPSGEAVPSSTNDASLVMRVDTGTVSVLLLGDTGRDAQAALRPIADRMRSDIIKVSHHGSGDHDPAFYRAVSGAVGDVALISVGRENGYGHPAQPMLATLAQTGVTTLRTDELGSIALSGSAGRLSAWSVRSTEEQTGHSGQRAQ